MSDLLIDWVKERLVSLYEQGPTSGEMDITGILGSTFKPNARILFNHQPIDQAKLGESIQKSSFAVTRADIEWKDIMTVPIEGNEENPKTGIVAGSFVVTRSMKFRIRAGPAQTLQYHFFSAKIEEEQIEELFVTSVSRQAPIHLQSVPNS